MREPRLTQDTIDPPDRPGIMGFLRRKLPYVAVLALAIFGVAYTNMSHQPLNGYWEFFGCGHRICLRRHRNILRLVSSPGISPGATGADNVLAVFSLPGNSFDVLGRGLNITAAGKFATTANNKTVHASTSMRQPPS